MESIVLRLLCGAEQATGTDSLQEQECRPRMVVMDGCSNPLHEGYFAAQSKQQEETRYQSKRVKLSMVTRPDAMAGVQIQVLI
jgi:hypothetical protein